MLEISGLLPITTDSHFGEYIQWAHDAVDHKGIIDFFDWYKPYCGEKRSIAISTEAYQEMVIPIIRGILADSGEEEGAVNIVNREYFIEGLPPDIAVEVPATIDRSGIHGVRLDKPPHGFAGLLSNHTAVHDLTAETVLQHSRRLALQALLADPVVDSLRAAEQSLTAIMALQRPYLDYLE